MDIALQDWPHQRTSQRLGPTGCFSPRWVRGDPLKRLWENDGLVELEAGSPGGIARGMTNLIPDKLLALPISGISPHLHVFLAFRDHVKATKNDRLYFKKDRSMELEPVFVMPKVATTYDEFKTAFGGAIAVEGAIA